MITRTQSTNSSMDPRAVRWIRVRVAGLGFFFAPMLLLMLGRAVGLQVVDGSKLDGMAKGQYLRQVTLPARRGPIYDRQGAALAASVDVDSIAVDPSEIKDPKKAAADLAKVLKLDREKLVSILSSNRQFAWLKRQVTPQEAAAVRALGLEGMVFFKEPRRFYPQRELASHVLGFAGLDGEGLEGLELALDPMLKGKSQVFAGLRDARGRAAITEGTVPTEALEGASVTLTLDKTIQYLAEKSLAAAVTKANAAAGAAVVLDPSTGEILALANVPTFNPNDARRYQAQALRNRAVVDSFEPGSTAKVFTIAAALEEKVVRPHDVIDCEGGRFAIGRHTIHDTHPYDEIDVSRIMQVSSNIGAAKIAERLGRERLRAYQQAFGFGERPGTGLQGEARGLLPFPKADVALATQSFGQGISVSALQLAAAFGAVANGGVLMRPYLVSRVVDSSGEVLVQRAPERVRQVVSQKTANELLKMMQLVVQKEGTAPLARMDDYAVAGKTGTSQKADPVTGGYSVDKRVASFAGIVPADAPRLIILVVIDEPKGQMYGGIVAAPAFKEIAQGALAHLGVPPSHGQLPSLVAGKDDAEPAPAKGSTKLSSAFAMAALKAPVATEGFIEDEIDADQTAVVPDLAGLTARDAVRALAAASLEPSLLGSGRAIGQTPPAGTTVRKGARVAVRLESRM